MSKIPVCFVTGFLGSGKTTFIERLVDRFAGKRVVYLVNEFSPKDVDGERLKLNEGDLVKIPGGSIFCKCLTGQFIKVLTEIGGMDIDGVVIEASGIANPKVAGDMFIETKLDEVFSITSIVAIVDPRSFLKLCITLPNIKEQVAASTHILVNKGDKYPPEKIAETVAAASELNKHAYIETTSFCNSEIDIFKEGMDVITGGEYAKCKDPNFCQVSVMIPDMDTYDVLKKKLAMLGDDLYRVKGCIVNPEGNLVAVDYEGSEWSIRDDRVSRREEAGEIVIIASGYKESTLEAIKKMFV